MRRPFPVSVRTAWAVAIGIAVFVWLGAKVPWQQLSERMAAVPGWSWGVTAIGLGLSYLLRALRLRAEWGSRLNVGTAECLHVTLTHNAAVNLLPLRAGEAGYAWLLHKRWGVPLAAAVGSLLWLRLQDALVLGLLALLWLAPLPWSLRLLLIGAVVAACFALLPLLMRVLPALPLQRLQGRRWGKALAQALQAIGQARRGRATWLLCIGNWLLKLAVLALLLSQLAELPAPGAAAGVVAGEVAALLPLQAPAGLGTYEAGVWFGIHTQANSGQGGPAVAGGSLWLGAALAVHALILLTACAGALALWLWNPPAPVMQRQERSAP
jgi:hypothetical protein